MEEGLQGIETLPEYYLDKEDALKMVLSCQI